MDYIVHIDGYAGCADLNGICDIFTGLCYKNLQHISYSIVLKI